MMNWHQTIDYEYRHILKKNVWRGNLIPKNAPSDGTSGTAAPSKSVHIML